MSDFNKFKKKLTKLSLNIVSSEYDYDVYEKVSFICSNKHTTEYSVEKIIKFIDSSQVVCPICRFTNQENAIEKLLLKRYKLSDIVHRSDIKYTHHDTIRNEFSFYIPSVNLYILWRNIDVFPFRKLMKIYNNIEVWVFDKKNNIVDIEYSTINLKK